MEKSKALSALAALAHETRLDVFRLLVAAGPEGMSAGRIARALDLAPATLSFHLNPLRQAGLVMRQREGRSLIQTVDFDAMDGLMRFLSENRCAGAECAVTRKEAET